MSILSATLYNKGFNSGNREVINVCEVTSQKKKKKFLKLSSLERRGDDKRVVSELKF